MAESFDLTHPEEVARGLRTARLQIGRKQAVVIPTDGGYALAVNAFSEGGIAQLRQLKGWSTPVPPQVLIPGFPTLTALAAEVHESVSALVEEFWPGALTVIVAAQPSLRWNLGDNRGTVALRMPAHPIAGELLAEVGPLAVSRATRAGSKASQIEHIIEEFGDEVACYLIDPALTDEELVAPSTVVDATGLSRPGGLLRIVREGAISREAVVAVVGEEHVEPVKQASPDAQPGVG
jgi:L-threonylcarbamoyladenylate synthase